MKTADNNITSTQEDYLEAIYMLTEKNKVARNKDIAEKLDVKRATVTATLKILAQKEFINYVSHGYITLTESGYKIAKDVANKHMLFNQFFTKILGLSEKEAYPLACKLEHVVKGEAFQRFSDLVDAIMKCTNNSKYCVSCKQDNEKCSTN